MSLNFGGKKSTAATNTNTTGTRDPWAPTVPLLNRTINQLGNAGSLGVTDKQNQAFDQLGQKAAAGNPYAGDQASYARDLYSTQSRAPEIDDAFGSLDRRLSPYADGSTDPSNDPMLQRMLSQVGTDAQDRVNAMFAGAGRDLSGMNQRAVGEGVSRETLPLLLQERERMIGRQMGSSQALYDASTGATTAKAGLDGERARLRGLGLEAGNAAQKLDRQGASEVLELEEQRKRLPYESMEALTSILFPAAGLGETQAQRGTSTTKGSQMGFGLGLNLLSDERAKEDIEPVGTMADGTTIYRYRYKGDDTGTVHMGPMAQDIAEKTPGATGVREDGMMTVNMDAATRTAADLLRKRRGDGYSG